MQKLIDGLKYFQNHVFWERKEQYERSVDGQKPWALLITCSDSRVLPETLMQTGPGDLFVSRNAGNLIPLPDVICGEAATIEYAVTVLGVKDIIVCGHYRCGAVRAIIYPNEGGALPTTREWLSHASAIRNSVATIGDDPDGEALWDRAVEENVKVQLDNLAKHPSVAMALEAGTVKLHGWVLRFESSEVLAFDQSSKVFMPLHESLISGKALSNPTACTENEGRKRKLPASEPEHTLWDKFRFDMPASLLVFAVALPMCIAISKACGVSATAGILTSIIGGIVVGIIGGGALQVSGPTAGLIVILVQLVEQKGVAALGIVVVLAGLIQIVAAISRLGKWFQAISPAVLLGMLAGIGIALFSQQLHVMVDDAPSKTVVSNLLNMPNALLGVFVDHGHPSHVAAALVGLTTLLILLSWNSVAPKRIRVLPSVLVSVILVSIAAYVLRLPVQRVEFDSLTSGISLPDMSILKSLLMDAATWQFAFSIAAIASAETLLTAKAVDQMQNGPKTKYNKELAAQGVGNILCGAIGALPMASVIVRSSVNVEAGARSRWATVFHGVWLLLLAVLAPVLLQQIPTAALAAILALTGLRLVQANAIRKLWNENFGEALICIATCIGVLATNLLGGVILGIGLSVIRLIYTFTKLGIEQKSSVGNEKITIQLDGSATFIGLPKLAATLDALPRGQTVIIDSRRLSYIDHACLELIENWEKQYRSQGGEAEIDWDTLYSRFRKPTPRPALDTNQHTIKMAA